MNRRRVVGALALAGALGAMVAPALVWDTPPWSLGGRYLGSDSTVLQLSTWDCGFAAAEMLVPSVEGRTLIGSARDNAQADPKALSLLEIRDLLATAGVAASGVSGSYPTLMTAPTPFIAHLPNHFVVVDSVTEAWIQVRDPARGRIEFSRQEFERLWTGALLLLTPPAATSTAPEASAASRP